MPEKLKIDAELLAGSGLGGLSQAETNVLLAHIYSTLEERVGYVIASKMTTEMLDEFEVYFNAKDDEGALAWLEEHVPSYREIVRTEFDTLMAELRQSAAVILTLLGDGHD